MDQPSAPSPFQNEPPAPDPRAFETGSVLAQTFSTFFGSFVQFSAIASLLFLPLLAVQLMNASNTRSVDMTLTIVTLVLQLVLGYLVNAALVYGVFQHLRGRPASFGEVLAQGLRRVLPALAVAIVVGFLTFLGMLFFCIPGLMILTAMYVAVPASVIENVGVIAAIRRSADLTDGARWRVFFIAAGLWLLGMMLGGVAGAAMLALDDPRLGVVTTWLVQVVSSSVAAVASSVVYFRLRQAKESLVDVETIAAVFD